MTTAVKNGVNNHSFSGKEKKNSNVTHNSIANKYTRVQGSVFFLCNLQIHLFSI